MTAENAGRSEFAEFVSHHVLGNVNRDELVAVVDSDCLAYKVGGNHGSPGPGLDGDLLVGLLSLDNSFFQFMEDVRTFL